mgnify:CR=1 FL=1
MTRRNAISSDGRTTLHTCPCAKQTPSLSATANSQLRELRCPTRSVSRLCPMALAVSGAGEGEDLQAEPESLRAVSPQNGFPNE